MTAQLIPDVLPLPETGAGATAVNRAALSRTERAELYELLAEHFEGVDPEQFAHDLDEKDWVLRVRRDERLVGFSTLQLLTARRGHEQINVIYSGDTIMAPDAWGSPVLARGWIALVRALQSTRPAERWYWLLLSSGFRTYRFLPVFWREFWPRYDAQPSSDEQALLSTLAHARFGAAFDASAGIVRFNRPQRLRAPLASVPDGRESDPHIRFFLSRNLGHANGDELVCLTELSDNNLTAAGVRMIRGTAR